MARTRRKKKRTHVQMGDEGTDDATTKNVPRSFVFRRGRVEKNTGQLCDDVRRMMQPHTAIRLRERKANQLKDFLSVAPQLGVTHFMIFAQTDVGVNLRVLRIPRGPTCTFRVLKFATAKDVVRIQKKPYSVSTEYLTAPLVVLSGFSGPSVDKQIMTAMFQNMFPPIDVANIRLSQCRRVVLFHNDEDTKTVQVRHYVVTASPVGINKQVKKIIKAKLPDLGKYEDVSEFVLEGGAGNASDSEREDTEDVRVTLAQDFAGRGNRRAQKSAVRLKELGPRMTLELLKIEEQACEGKVLYHSYIHKSKQEQEELAAAKRKKEREREERKRVQEENVRRKQEAKDAKKQRKLERRLQRQQMGQDDGDESDEEDEDEDEEKEIDEGGEEMDDGDVDDSDDEEEEEEDGDPYGIGPVVSSEGIQPSKKQKMSSSSK